MLDRKEAFLGLRGNALSWAITMCAGSAFLLFGYDQGVLGSIISGSDFLDALGISKDDPDTLSTVVSIYDIGVSVPAVLHNHGRSLRPSLPFFAATVSAY